MYTYVTICRDISEEEMIGVLFEESRLLAFETKEQAFDEAYKSAMQEVEDLNIGADDGISFGIPENDMFQSMDVVIVNYYYEDETEIVTERSIVEIVPYEDVK